MKENIHNLLKDFLTKENSAKNFSENLEDDDNKLTATAKKILEIFKIKGTTFQLVFPNNAFINSNPEENNYYNILQEAKLINSNGNFTDMITLNNYTNLIEYKKVENFLSEIFE